MSSRLRRALSLALLAALPLLCAQCALGVQLPAGGRSERLVTGGQSALESRCTTTVLRARGGTEGAPFGTADGDVDFTNTGSRACELLAPSSISLINSHKVVLATSAGGIETARPRILLPRGKTVAVLVVYWMNWCHPGPGPVSLVIKLPEGKVTAPFTGSPNYNYVPRCTEPKRASWLQIVAAYQP